MACLILFLHPHNPCVVPCPTQMKATVSKAKEALDGLLGGEKAADK